MLRRDLGVDAGSLTLTVCRELASRRSRSRLSRLDEPGRVASFGTSEGGTSARVRFKGVVVIIPRWLAQRVALLDGWGTVGGGVLGAAEGSPASWVSTRHSCRSRASRGSIGCRRRTMSSRRWRSTSLAASPRPLMIR